MNLKLTGDTNKILWFAGCGAVGALIAALLGEVWLRATQGTVPPTSISLLLDCSGSMSTDSKLQEMQAAAAEFVERHTLPNTQLSVVSFDTTSRVEAPLSAERASIAQAIGQLRIGGSTNMEAGLQAALGTLPALPGSRFIVLFTDGMPDELDSALREARRCRAGQVTIIAVATDDADRDYLTQLTGDSNLVFAANPGEFARAFRQVERQLHDLVSTSAASAGFSLVRIGIWTALLACGIGLALVAGQNFYLGRRALTPDEAKWGAVGSLVAGLVAGIIGQLVFFGVATSSGLLVFLGRSVGWLLMGALLGVGLARFIPNLKLERGALGGAIGGVLGLLGFGLVALLLAETPGRWAGAVILGACVGAMIAWIDVLLREAWLEVEYGPGEIRTVSLGREPVTVGSVAGKCTVFVPAPDPTTLRYQLKDGQVVCEEIEQGRQTIVQLDEPRLLGKALLRVKGIVDITGPLVAAAASSAPSAVARHGARGAPTTGATTAEEGALLLVVGWQQIPLVLGAHLGCHMLPGLEPDGQRDVVAEVVSHPQEVGVYGLKNRSRIAWEAITPEGKALLIDPGRSVRVASGTTLRFGITEGKITHSS